MREGGSCMDARPDPECYSACTWETSCAVQPLASCCAQDADQQLITTWLQVQACAWQWIPVLYRSMSDEDARQLPKPVTACLGQGHACAGTAPYRKQLVVDGLDVLPPRHTLHQDVPDLPYQGEGGEHHQPRKQESAERVYDPPPRVILRGSRHVSEQPTSVDTRLHRSAASTDACLVLQAVTQCRGTDQLRAGRGLTPGVVQQRWQCTQTLANTHQCCPCIIPVSSRCCGTT